MSIANKPSNFSNCNILKLKLELKSALVLLSGHARVMALSFGLSEIDFNNIL